MSSSEVLFLMSGSIAAYKACHVISRLTQAGHRVQVVASPSALRFVGAATLEGLSGRAVVSDLWEAGRAMDHIHLVRRADLILAAPASAHFINRIAHGLGDDLLTTMFLAHDFSKPFLISPAMNTTMYQHPATQASLALLRGMGVEILEAASGVLACGEVGYGKLLDPDLILAEVTKRLSQEAVPSSNRHRGPLKPRKILITAGGTSEKIDPVRRITNISTGATGRYLAENLSSIGFDVTLLRSINAQPSLNQDIRQVVFDDTASLETNLRAELSNPEMTHVIHLAAVSDYRPAKARIDGREIDLAEEKIPSGRNFELIFEPVPKLIQSFRQWAGNRRIQVAGFKLTSHLSADKRKEAATQVLEHSDLVVGNDIAEFDLRSNDHPYMVYQRTSDTPLAGRSELAAFLGNWIMTGDGQ